MLLTDHERIAAQAIVANIADLEAARHFLTNTMDRWLLDGMLDVLRNKARSFNWIHAFDPNDEGSYFVVPKNWATSGIRSQKFNEDAWLYLGAHEGDRNNVGESWIACATGKAPSRNWLAFGFGQQVVTKTVWCKILGGNPAIIEDLRRLGFNIELREGLIDYPVTIDPEALSRAFEVNDFNEASSPLETAIDVAFNAKPLFDKLVGAIREQS